MTLEVEAGHTYELRTERPPRVWVVDTLTGETVWSGIADD